MFVKDRKSSFRALSVGLGLALILSLGSMAAAQSGQSGTGTAGSRDAAAQTLTASIGIDTSCHTGPVNKLLFGSQVTAIHTENWLLDPDYQFNGDALHLIRELRPSILRFDGQPIFEDGIGDQQSRPTGRCGWEYWKSYEYGIDEHMALLETIAAEGNAVIIVGYPAALVNSADPSSCITSSISSNLSQMVSRAMAWVAYLNGAPADSTVIGVDDHGFDWQTVGHWAQKRVTNGHLEPYGVKFWEIGNEVYYHHDRISPETYGHVYIAFQQAMKQVDPSIVVGACVRIEQDTSWNARLLSVIGSSVDALVLHVYYPDVPYDPTVRHSVLAAATQVDDDLARLRQLLATTTDRADEVKLLLTELGIFYDWRYEDPITWNTLLVALYDVDLMGVLVHRSADYRIELAIQHWLHGEAATADIYFDPYTEERYARPDYYASQMWTKHFGDVLVQNTVTCDTFDVPERHGNVAPHYDIPYLAAHTSIAGDKLYLLVINRHLTDSITTAVHIEGFLPQSDATVYTLNAPSIEATNEYGSHDSVVIATSDISDASYGFTYVFPAHSVTVIELSMDGHRVYLPIILR